MNIYLQKMPSIAAKETMTAAVGVLQDLHAASKSKLELP